VKIQLAKCFDIRDLGPVAWFLGIRILRDRQERKIWLCQDTYIQKLAKSFNIETNKKSYVDTPIPPSFSLARFEGTADSEIVKGYQRRIGSILYAAITTRPDVAHHCSILTDHLLNPGPNHMRAADRVLEYLIATATHAIQYEPAQMNPINAFTDASYGDNPNRTSSQGYLFKFYGGPVV
jgi:hypothetical protein